MKSQEELNETVRVLSLKVSHLDRAFVAADAAFDEAVRLRDHAIVDLSSAKWELAISEQMLELARRPN